MKRLRSLWRRLDVRTRNALIAARNVAGWTFVTLFGTTVLGFAQDVVGWSSSSGADPFPGLSVLGYGVVSALAAATTGAVAGAVRWAQGRLGRGNPPAYE
jgi:hypothetical protein